MLNNILDFFAALYRSFLQLFQPQPKLPLDVKENSRWATNEVIYYGRVIPNYPDFTVPLDVRNFIFGDDYFLKKINRDLGISHLSNDEKSHKLLNYVIDNLSYVYDEKSQGFSEFWQLPTETLALGTGDCIAEYEEVYTKEGTKTVRDLEINDLVLSYDFIKKEYCYKSVIKIWEKGHLETFRVFFRNGQSIDITADHYLPVRQNQTKSEYVKTRLKDIDLTKWNTRKIPTAKQIPYEVKDIDWLTEDICFVVGHYLAEGWREKEGKEVCTSGCDLDHLILPILDDNLIPYQTYVNNSGVPCLRFHKSKLKSFLLELKNNSFDINLPEYLFGLPKIKLQRILDGFFIGDGHHSKYADKRDYKSNKDYVFSTSSKQFADDIQRIGLQLGTPFHVWKQKEHKGIGNSPIYRITYNSKSHFSKDYGYKNLSEVSIKSVESLGLVKARDFEVEDTHIYILKNGLLSHNCEDGAILLASMMINAGVPKYRVKVAAGLVDDFNGGTGGHAYCIYKRESDDRWVTLDWCYLANTKAVKDRTPLKENEHYKEIWFTFNDQFSWTEQPLELKTKRLKQKL